MTKRTYSFIELSDIMALRCECKNPDCAATLILPLSKAVTKETLRLCPKCKGAWAMSGQSSFELEITKLVDVLADLRRIEEHLGFSLSLEIKGEKDNEIRHA